LDYEYNESFENNCGKSARVVVLTNYQNKVSDRIFKFQYL